ncbi:putative two-component response regulator [Kineosphaera limosa NBRC 100340]|uniref:Putative two-component response regulator n=1 Tax=Kineosphaera limosa NBRC 100340 TaxID=1184609 RepID=K6X6H3_9MICO|nr:putative two-component response regulator [Kineosphaera limosa NBRC 100340]
MAKKTTKATKATKAKAADSDAPASTDETRAAPNVETAETAASSDTGSNEPTDAVDARAAGRDGGGLRVVVAEDEALIRLDLAEMLEEAGYEVVGQAPDGQQAVELVREHKPDLVVMDVKMPVLDGISAAEIVGSEHLAPVVMLTAFSDKTLVERARDAGVMAYVVKPFTIDDLRPAIDIARSRWDEIRALESEIADLGERLETRKAVDRAKGVLMTQLKLSEPDAFRWIQKTAMDRRLGMREVAEAVINGLPGKR